MNIYQTLFLLLFSFFSYTGIVYGLKHSRQGKAYELDGIYNIIGAFVWADAVVFGIFWMIIPLFVIFMNDFLLFFVFLSLFWLVRSIGEVQYWKLEQFSHKRRNSPEKFFFHTYFNDDSVWVVMQIYWQCLTVVSAVASIYTVALWVEKINY